MARQTHVKKAQKDQGTCTKCGEPIVAGQAYVWVKLRPGGPRSSLRLARHEGCPNWRQSELTFSKMRGVYAAEEELTDAVEAATTPEDVTSAMEAWSEAVREVAEEYRESAENIRDGFGHDTYRSEELDEKADELESWADDGESALDGVEGMDDVESILCEAHETEPSDCVDCEHDEETDEVVEECDVHQTDPSDCADCKEKRQEALNEAAEAATAHAGECPV